MATTPSRIPTYSEMGGDVQAPASAVPLATVDTSPLLRTLRDWQDREGDEYLRGAVEEAKNSGSVEALAAYQKGESLPAGRTDTQAGRAYTDSARAAYVAGLENDWAQTASRLATEHPLDPDAYGKKAKAAIDGSLQRGLDPGTAAQARLRAESIFGREQSAIIDAVAAKGRADRGEAIQTALRRRAEDSARAARSGNPSEGMELWASIDKDLRAAQADGTIPASWAEAFREKTNKEITFEAYRGDFDDASDKPAWLATFKKSRPEDMSPEEHRKLVNAIEADYKDQIESDLLRATQERTDAILLVAGDDPEDALKRARAISGDETLSKDFRARLRDKVEAEVEARLDKNKALREWQRNEDGRRFRQAVLRAPTREQLVDLVAEHADLDPEDHAWAREWVAKMEKGEEPKTNWTLFSELSQESAQNPTAFTKRDLTLVRDQLSDEDYKSLVSFQRSAENELRRRAERDQDTATRKEETAEKKREDREREDRERQERFVITHVNEVVSNTAASFGITKDKAPEKFGQVYERTWRWAERVKPTTRQEVQDYVDGLLLRDDGGWFGGSKYLFEAPREDFQVPGVPRDNLPELTETLRQAGQRLTVENYQRLWKERETRRKAAEKAQKNPLFGRSPKIDVIPDPALRGEGATGGR